MAGAIHACNECTSVKPFNEQARMGSRCSGRRKRQILLSNQRPDTQRAGPKSRGRRDHLPEISKGVAIIGNL